MGLKKLKVKIIKKRGKKKGKPHRTTNFQCIGRGL